MKNAETKINELSITELMSYKTACSMLKDHYTKMVMTYNHTINPEMKSESEKITQISAIESAIINTIENKVLQLS